MKDRRKPVRLPDGSYWSEAAFAALIAEWQRRAPLRVTVRRLSHE